MRGGGRRWGEVTALTVCACIITMLALPDYSSIDTYADSPGHGAMTDFYERTAHNAGVTELDTLITIVSIDDCSHRQIAAVLDIVNDCMPAAIGLDVLFYTLDNDSALKSAIKNASPALVLPINGGEVLPSQSFVNPDSLPLARFGRPDLSQSHRGAPIRNYYVRVDGEDSFGAQLARLSGYGTDGLRDTEPLRYGAREFMVVDARQMLESDYIPADKLYGKIVVMGTMRDTNDMHYTPIDNDMPGAMIHAYALSSMISGQPVKSFPNSILYIAALLFTAATIAICMRVDNRPYANLVSRIIPIAIIVIFIYLCYYIYSNHNVYIDFTIVLAMTAAGMLAYDIYTGVPPLFKALSKRISNF